MDHVLLACCESHRERSYQSAWESAVKVWIKRPLMAMPRKGRVFLQQLSPLYLNKDWMGLLRCRSWALR